MKTLLPLWEWQTVLMYIMLARKRKEACVVLSGDLQLFGNLDQMQTVFGL
ncbi:hypothetical protein PAHA111176_20930 [Parendozoicomonas haliclonae]|uniref:Uncharacterized protein n=1 Tax=Parendozoicomonas haliclonae TaxID=1960125 RepID=A0A1X7ART2_9GAMM|nr:hypothetical protein EHSB41UT_04659 [Parendozoicomonas haliclonae]